VGLRVRVPEGLTGACRQPVVAYRSQVRQWPVRQIPRQLNVARSVASGTGDKYCIYTIVAIGVSARIVFLPLCARERRHRTVTEFN
jgi:hypothetical protein